uniref:VEFS-Box domain-containing protein n=1 Tax=Mesocestoides corti TaxID=53468 RepID=A0A5K3F0V2_MESCO
MARSNRLGILRRSHNHLTKSATLCQFIQKPTGSSTSPPPHVESVLTGTKLVRTGLKSSENADSSATSKALNGTSVRAKRLKAKRRLNGTRSSLPATKKNSASTDALSHVAKPDASRFPSSDAIETPFLSPISSSESHADYEEFVRAFAVPTHLYRYLASRHRLRPIYLTRNLRYMWPARVDSDKVKRDRKIENVVAKIYDGRPVRPRRSQRTSTSASPTTNCNGPELALSTQWPDEVELIVEGFFDSEKETDWVTVEAKLTLQSRLGWTWRRKSRQRDTLVLLGRDVDCACNPEKAVPSSGSNSYRFRLSEMLEAAGGEGGGPRSPALVCQRVSSAQLELRVKAKERRRAKRINGCAPGETLSQTAYVVHYSTAPLPLFYVSPPAATSCGDSARFPQFLLSPGLYELRLGIQAEPEAMPPNVSQLSTLAADSAMSLEGGAATSGGDRVSFQGPGEGAFRFPKVSAAVDEYSRWPRLRFHVVWHSSAASGKTARQRHNSSQKHPSSVPLRLSSPKSVKRHSADSLPTPPSMSPISLLTPTSTTPTAATTPQKLQKHQSPDDPVASTPVYVTYRFLYGEDDKRLQQWSETQDMICPWCKLNCRRGQANPPSSLLAHLRSCHPRFRFRANWNPRRQHLSLEVSLNDSYDGSNDCVMRSHRLGTASTVAATSVDPCLLETAASRNPNQLPLVGGWTGYGGGPEDVFRNSRRAAAEALLREHRPSKRLPYTHLIYWRGAEHLVRHPLESSLTTRPLAVGHNRVYFHTTTMQPISPAVFDEHDSESEDAPEWLCQHYQRKVEEFTDVNKVRCIPVSVQLGNSTLGKLTPRRLLLLLI